MSALILRPRVSRIILRPQGRPGRDGSGSGGGLPPGGTSGQILVKQSNTNGDAEWVSNLDAGTFN